MYFKSYIVQYNNSNNNNNNLIFAQLKVVLDSIFCIVYFYIFILLLKHNGDVSPEN